MGSALLRVSKRVAGRVRDAGAFGGGRVRRVSYREHAGSHVTGRQRVCGPTSMGVGRAHEAAGDHVLRRSQRMR